MKIKPFVSLILSLCVFSPVLSQKTTDDDVVRITTNLVQVDAVVTKDGKLVRNLKAEDFEIFEDGKRQTITSFSFISNIPTTTASTAPGAKAAERDPSVPPAPLKPEDSRRTIAIVVDDLGLSAESMGNIRPQLRKFVTEQIQPHDLVAIIRTGMDVGALQQFTNDKRLLMRTVDQIRWNGCSRVGPNVLPPFNPGLLAFGGNRGCGRTAHTFMSLRSVVEAMSDLPGRKSIMVLSDSMPIEDQSHEFNGVAWGSIDSYNRLVALRRIAEMAIRRSVVIYSIDTQGLQPTGITAADSFRGGFHDITYQMNELIADRGRLLFERRAGGDLIARQTGGFQVKNSNDLKLDRVLEDQSGYYLIGYRPTGETFNRRFHKITAKVKRSGMTLRTRFGFFGYPEEEDVRRPPQSKMGMALRSPFGAQEIDVNLTSFFVNDKSAGSAIRSFLFMNAKDLTFEIVKDKREAKIELQGVVFGENGMPIGQARHFGVVSLTDDEYQQALRNGIRIRFDMLARRPGSFQVRAAARDLGSSRIGAAGDIVLVPDLDDKQLALSGVVLQGVSDAPQTGVLQTTEASPAAGRFAPNSDLYSTFVIYNASLDPLSQRPKLTIQSKLFRDGKLVFTYSDIQVDTANQPDLARIRVNLQFRLGADLEPGHYHLQLAVTDNALKDKLKDKQKYKQPPAIQWADFEIVKTETSR